MYNKNSTQREQISSNAQYSNMANSAMIKKYFKIFLDPGDDLDITTKI